MDILESLARMSKEWLMRYRECWSILNEFERYGLDYKKSRLLWFRPKC